MLRLPLYCSNREFWGLLDLSLGPALTTFNTKLLIGLDIVPTKCPFFQKASVQYPFSRKLLFFVFGDSHVGIALK
jgi:hypothetical protein